MKTLTYIIAVFISYTVAVYSASTKYIMYLHILCTNIILADVWCLKYLFPCQMCVIFLLGIIQTSICSAVSSFRGTISLCTLHTPRN